jgi:membrane-associated phospholipid phosphatase
MGTSSKKDKKSKPTNPPEQKLGDTPVPPWEMPTPAEKAQAKPVKRALKKAIAKVDSEEKAEEVIDHLEVAVAGQTTADVENVQPETLTTADAAHQVEKAAQTAPKGEGTEKVLETTARVLTAPDKRQREAVSEAAQEVLNPEQQGAVPTVENIQQREYLRKTVLRRLKPLDALDANLFLAVNHLPHTRFFNVLFYGFTLAFNGGVAWYIAMGIAALRNRRKVRDILWEVGLPLTITTMLVEYPIKTYFKRRRPFISIIQAIVIGKKPGTWSFPSGHSAAAFAGARLLSRKFPRFGILRYAVAGMVAFSRIYLGDHYPGDVASGSLLGMLFANFFSWLVRLWRKR